MKNFDVQGIDLNVSRNTALAFIADPAQLPRWTNAFASVDRILAGERSSSDDVSGETIFAARGVLTTYAVLPEQIRVT